MKDTPSESVVYELNGSTVVGLHKILSDDSEIRMVFHHDEAGLLVGLSLNGNEYFYERDILGNILSILDINGNVMVRYAYDAWGKPSIKDVAGSENSSLLSVHNPFLFKGYCYDLETGWHYLKSRYYDPTLGRFVNADDVNCLDPVSLNGTNLYAYCENNPVMNMDPDGTFVISLTTALIVTFIVSAGASAVSQGLQYGWDNINIAQVGIDGLFGAASIALAATGIGIVGSIAFGASMGVGQYAIASTLHFII